MPQVIPPLRSFADRLSYLLRSRSLSQVKLAEDIEVSQANISRWLKGTVPEMKFALALSKRFEVSLEWLLEGEGKQPTRLESFLSEIRTRKIPEVEAQIRKTESAKGVSPELTKVALHSLREVKAKYERMIEFVEKHGEDALGAEYLSQEEAFEKKRIQRKDAAYYKRMLAEAMGVSPEISDDELATAHELFLKRSAKVGPVKAAVENLRKSRPGA